MKLSITELQHLLNLVHQSEGYNDGDMVPNDLAVKLHDEIESRTELLMADKLVDEAKEHGLPQ